MPASRQKCCFGTPPASRARSSTHRSPMSSIPPQGSGSNPPSPNARRERPLAYITGTREFYRLEFRVTPDVLIPRPESELLVDAALDHMRQARIRTAQVADVGAGSGAVGIALAKHRRGINLICSDVSRDALLVARDNARRLLRRPNASFVQGDLLTPLPGPSTVSSPICRTSRKSASANSNRKLPNMSRVSRSLQAPTVRS